jgi:outer membrane protein
MKKITLVLNIVLLIAVAVLYYLHFSCKSNCKHECKKNVSGTALNNSHKPMIAYVDLDSMNERIEYIKKNRLALEQEQKSIESEWEASYRDLENQKNNFLKKSSSITQSQAESFQKILLDQQQRVDTKKQMLTQQLNEKSYKFLEDIQKQLKQYLQEYNQDKGYSFILTVGNGLDYMVYKDSSLNITNDVVEGMNEKLKSKEK